MRILFFILALFANALIAFGLFSFHGLGYESDSLFITRELFAYKDIVANLSTNSTYYVFRPLAYLGLSNPRIEASIILGLMGGGVSLLLSRNKLSFSKDFLISIIVCAGVQALVGRDIAILQALLFIPYLAALLKNGLLTVFLSIFYSVVSPEHALIGLLASLLLYFSISDKKEPFSPFLLLALTVCGVAPYLISYPEVPPYPEYVRVLTSRSLLSGIDPLVGASSSIAFIDRIFLRASFENPALFLIFLNLLLLILRPIRLNLIPLFFALSLALDTSLVSASLSQISPLYTLERLIPGLHLFPLHSFAAALSLLSVAINLKSSSLAKEALLAFLLSLTVGFFALKDSAYASNKTAIEQSLPLAIHLNGEVRSCFYSPSRALLLKYGLDHFKDLANERQLHPRQLDRIKGISLNASHNEVLLEKLLNRPSHDSRWTTAIGEQAGGEFVEISLNPARRVKGLFLETGRFSSDFPRGIKASLISCEGKKLETQLISPWEGKLRRKGALLFLEAEAKVEVRFQSLNPVCKVRVEQTAKNCCFDWSITKILLATPHDPEQRL